MPFAAIYVPDFPVEAIVRAEPSLRERAVVVTEGTPPLVKVIAVNENASEIGVEPGMTKLEAEELLAAAFAEHGSETRATQASQTQPGCMRHRSAQSETAAHAALLDCACGFSPRVEDTAADTIIVDIAGLERVFGPATKIARDIARRCSEVGLEANVAVASNPDAAMHAARGFAGVTVLEAGREAERLGGLPVDVLAPECAARAANAGSQGEERLPTHTEIIETLDRWGVRNLRALAALPEVAIAERLGQLGLQLQKLARGATSRPLVPAEPPLVFEEAMELEYPVYLLEPLAFMLNRMLEQLCARLSARALATTELRLMLELDSNGEDRVIGRSDDRANEDDHEIARSGNHQITRCLRLPVAMLDARVFLKLLQLELQSHPPGAPVVKVWLSAEPAEPRRTQNGLFQPQAPEPEKLELTLARIKRVVEKGSGQGSVGSEQDGNPALATVGATQERVGSPELLDTHRPDAFRMQKFVAPGPTSDVRKKADATDSPHTADVNVGSARAISALRVFRPALSAVVMVRDGQPARIASAEKPTLRGDVIWCAGPWRTSGEWWSEQVWSREEWDIAVHNEEGVTVYRVYRDEIADWWRIEGTYD